MKGILYEKNCLSFNYFYVGINNMSRFCGKVFVFGDMCELKIKVMEIFKSWLPLFLILFLIILKVFGSIIKDSNGDSWLNLF